jgi:hypothetical protein
MLANLLTLNLHLDTSLLLNPRANFTASIITTVPFFISSMPVAVVTVLYIIYTSLTPVENLSWSLIICYINFRTINFSWFPTVLLYSTTCYRMIHRGRSLKPSAKKNKHKWSIVNPLLYIVHYISQGARGSVVGSRHYATSRKVLGSIPNEVSGFLNWRNPSSRTMILWSTQPLNRNEY